MSNYFYHPLGNYAENDVSSASLGALPHTYASHGFGNVAFGTDGEQNVYSMTNGTVAGCGEIEEDGKKFYMCVIKTGENGYSQMQSKLQGGSSSDYPLYITYSKMNSLASNIKLNDTIKQGQKIGTTNTSIIPESINLQISVHPYNIYDTSDKSDKAQLWPGAIALGQYDAYGNKGDNYKLIEHMDNNFSFDGKGIKDHSGKYIGVQGLDGLYYPPNKDGVAVTKYEYMDPSLNPGNLDPNLEIGRWYSHLFMMQTPFKVEGRGINSPMGWTPKDDWSDGIEGYYANEKYTFPVYLQGRGPWASKKFWEGYFSGEGCSVTAAATIASGITGKTVLPTDIADAYKAITGYNPYPGFSMSNDLGPLVEYCGGKSLGKVKTMNEVKQHLIQKHPVELNMSTKGSWGNGYRTKNGHLIALLDFDEENNKVFLADPNSAHKSGWFDWQPFVNNWAGYAEAFE